MGNGTSAIGDILQGMGPGLLSGIGKAISDSSQNATHFEKNQPGIIQSKNDNAKPSYKNGTDYVPKTGEAILHKGEAVLNKEDADKHRGNKMENVKLSHHRVVMHLHKGGLHRALGIDQDKEIPKERIEEAMHSKNEHVAKMANLAHTMGEWHK